MFKIYDKKATCTVIESTEIKILLSLLQENQHKMGTNQHLLQIYKSNISQKQGQRTPTKFTYHLYLCSV